MYFTVRLPIYNFYIFATGTDNQKCIRNPYARLGPISLLPDTRKLAVSLRAMPDVTVGVLHGNTKRFYGTIDMQFIFLKRIDALNIWKLLLVKLSWLAKFSRKWNFCPDWHSKLSPGYRQNKALNYLYWTTVCGNYIFWSVEVWLLKLYVRGSVSHVHMFDQLDWYCALFIRLKL